MPIFSPLLPHIARLMKSKSLYLFCDKDGANFKDIAYIRGKAPYGAWAKLLKKCDIRYRKIYQTRHTFATHMLMSGKYDLLTIARWMGHVNIQILIKNYAKFIKGEKINIENDFDPFATDSSTDSRKKEVDLKVR